MLRNRKFEGNVHTKNNAVDSFCAGIKTMPDRAFEDSVSRVNRLSGAF